MHEVVQFLLKHGDAVIFFWVFAGQLGIPLPAAPLLLAVGALTEEGWMNLHRPMVWGIVASLVANVFWYWIGRRKGIAVISLVCRISINPDSCVRKTSGLFSRYGAPSLLIARFIPGFNAIAPPLAGVFRMNFLSFLFYDSLGAVIWVGVFVGFGYLFRDQIEDLILYAQRTGIFLAVILIGILAVFLFWKYTQRRKFLRQLRMARITPEDLKAKLDGGEEVVILDVRHLIEFQADPQTLPGAFYLPLEQLNENHQRIPRDREVIVYCN